MVSQIKPKVAVISTGNSEIDKKMGGGIPQGSLTLVEGHSDAGKSVLVQQLTWGSLNQGYSVAVLTTENTVSSLIRQMTSLSFDVTDHFLLGKLRIYPMQAIKTKDDPTSGLGSLLRAMDRERGRALLVVDSLTGFISHVSPEDAIAFFEGCKKYTKGGTTLLLVVHAYAFTESTLVRLSSLCDAHLRLRIEQIGAQLMKVMEVAKVRGAQKTTGNIISFEVEPNWGMRIIPFSRARA
ncbi:MAG: flagellar accessory protein FlaH [Chloroflexi bacterium]|nr:flagellar accessory protein FlaH [Chloroflexota bacterium]